jgi:hypothetical protein
MFCSNVRNANYATVLPSSSKRSRGDARLLWFEIVKEKPSLKGRTYRVRHWIEINRARRSHSWQLSSQCVWASIDWEESLTLGRALASAYSKGKAPWRLCEPTPEAVNAISSG